jgi:hypothetical protein
MHHSESEHFASLAEIAIRERDFDRAVQLYRNAAEEEMLALADLDQNKVRTVGITAVSAASLWYKAKEFSLAQNVAHKWLGNEHLPSFAKEQLKLILQNIWSDELREKSGIKFTKGEVLISVSGGDVVVGGAPLELILRKVSEVSGLFYRTIEMQLGQPFRKHGPPTLQIQEQCRPWLFQAPPGSYQFAVRVQQPPQMPLFPNAGPRVEQVTEKFLDIVRASTQDPEGELTKIVPDPQYRAAFLKITRNLAPTGNTFSKLEIKSTNDFESRPIVILPESRDIISEAIRRPGNAEVQTKAPKELRLKGVLRALHLDKDWLEVTVIEEGQEKHIKVTKAGDAIDDIVGPMVNRSVIIDVVEVSKGKYSFRDIQSDE